MLTKFIMLIFAISLTYSLAPHSLCLGKDEHTPSLAIFDFTERNGEISEESVKLSLLIFATISKEGKIRLIERAEIEKATKEQKLSQSGLVSQDGALKLGKIVGAENILNGKIYYMDNKIYFNGKLANCGSSKINGISMSFSMNDDKDTMLESFSKKISEYIEKFFENDKQDDK